MTRVAGRQAGKQEGLSGDSVEKLRWAGVQEAKQNDAKGFCRQADKDISIWTRAETLKHKMLSVSNTLESGTVQSPNAMQKSSVKVVERPGR